MKEKIKQLVQQYDKGGFTYSELEWELLNLYAVSKRHLLESIIDDVKQSHSEYAVEKIESYLDDGC